MSFKLEHLLHVLSHLEEYQVPWFQEPLVTINSIEVVLALHLGENDALGLLLGRHVLQRFMFVVLIVQVMEMRRLKTSHLEVQMRQNRCKGGRGEYILRIILFGHSQ